MDEQALRALIAEVADFPRPGGSSQEITPLLACPDGFAAALAGLVEDQGGIVAVLAFLLELDPLGGRGRLGERPISSLLRYSR